MIAALLLAAVLPGLYAPASAAGTLGLEPLDAKAQVVVMEIERQLGASSWLRAVTIDNDPATSDCRDKPYAAATRIATSAERGEGGWTFDAGMVLLDCAGWNVDEWHESLALAHPPTDADAEKLAFNLLIRLRTWTKMQPVLASELFTTGLAYDPKTEKPTYFYTLFKTDDGNMRALVRPGGPAYEAGMRTNDIVEKLDGKWWWEYGTYQTERRAYDGKPHTFELVRGTQKLTVTLGQPFSPGA
jgi:hypothetical protein